MSPYLRNEPPARITRPSHGECVSWLAARSRRIAVSDSRPLHGTFQVQAYARRRFSAHPEASLLIQLRDGGNHAAWQEFASLLTVHSDLRLRRRSRGLQDADAADLMQDVMRSISHAIARLDYDRNQGTFRGWLFTITRNKIFSFFSSPPYSSAGFGRHDDNQPFARYVARRPATARIPGRWNISAGWRRWRWSV